MATVSNERGDTASVTVQWAGPNEGLVITPTINKEKGQGFTVQSGVERGSVVKVKLIKYLYTIVTYVSTF